MKKTTYIILALACSFSGTSTAVSKYAFTKYYYATEAKKTVIGTLTVGCTTSSIKMVGEKSPYLNFDEVMHDCGSLGNYYFGSVLGSCFQNHPYVNNDDNNDGFVDGYSSMVDCFRDEWNLGF